MLSMHNLYYAAVIKTRCNQIILFRNNLITPHELELNTNAVHNEHESVWTNFARLGGAEAFRAKPWCFANLPNPFWSMLIAISHYWQTVACTGQHFLCPRSVHTQREHQVGLKLRCWTIWRLLDRLSNLQHQPSGLEPRNYKYYHSPENQYALYKLGAGKLN